MQIGMAFLLHLGCAFNSRALHIYILPLEKWQSSWLARGIESEMSRAKSMSFYFLCYGTRAPFPGLLNKTQRHIAMRESPCNSQSSLGYTHRSDFNYC